MAADDASADDAAEAPPPSDCNAADGVRPDPPTAREPDGSGEPFVDVAPADDESTPPSLVPRYNDVLCAPHQFTHDHWANVRLNNKTLKVQPKYRAIGKSRKKKSAFVGKLIQHYERKGTRFIHLNVETGVFSLATYQVKKDTVQRRLIRKENGEIMELPPVPPDMSSLISWVASSIRGSVCPAAKKRGQKSKPRTKKGNNTRRGKPKSKSKAPRSSGSKRGRPTESSSSRRAKAPRTTPTPRRSSTSAGAVTLAKGTASTRAESTASTRAESTASRGRGRSTSKKRAEDRAESKRPVEGNAEEPPEGETMSSFYEGLPPAPASSSSNSTTKKTAPASSSSNSTTKKQKVSGRESSESKSRARTTEPGATSRTLTETDILEMTRLGFYRDTRSSKPTATTVPSSEAFLVRTTSNAGTNPKVRSSSRMNAKGTVSATIQTRAPKGHFSLLNVESTDRAVTRGMAKGQQTNRKEETNDTVISTCPLGTRDRSTLEVDSDMEVPGMKGGSLLRIIPEFLSPEECEGLTGSFKESDNWKQYFRKQSPGNPLKVGFPEPRLHFLMMDGVEASDPSEAGPGYKYHDVKMKAVPIESLPGIKPIADKLAAACGVKDWNLGINPVLLTSGADKIGWHSDQSSGEEVPNGQVKGGYNRYYHRISATIDGYVDKI